MTIKVKNIDTSTIEGKIAVMRAYKDGAKIAMRAKRYSSEGWISAANPAWSWHSDDYAVIEEPLEVWVVVGEMDGKLTSVTFADSKASAESWESSWNHPVDRARYRVVKMREVQE